MSSLYRQRFPEKHVPNHPDRFDRVLLESARVPLLRFVGAYLGVPSSSSLLHEQTGTNIIHSDLLQIPHTILSRERIEVVQELGRPAPTYS